MKKIISILICISVLNTCGTFALAENDSPESNAETRMNAEETYVETENAEELSVEADEAVDDEAMLFAATASGDCGENAHWELDNGTLTITGTGAMSNYGSHNQPWYSQKSSITKVIISDGITNIGNYAFNICTSLQTAELAESVISINDNAFNGCNALQSITMPKVETIGNEAFMNCQALNNVTLPDELTSIGTRSFASCYAFTDMRVPERVTAIGEGAFRSCKNMVNITLPASLTSISKDAFNSCSALKTLYFTGEIGAFNSITMDTSVTNVFNKLNKHYGVVCDGDLRYYFRDDYGTLEIAGKGDAINSDIWNGNTKIAAVIIPQNITTIGENAFSGCSNLKKIYYIGDGKNIEVKEGNDEFESAAKYTNVYVSDTDNTIYNYTDKNQTRLVLNGHGVMTNYDDSDSSYANKSPWRKNTQLSTVTFEDGLTSVGSYSFIGCTNISNVVLSDSVVNINNGAFSGCTNLKDITISSSVESIGADAFKDCNIKDVYFTGTKSQWNAITKSAGNDALSNATVHYNVKTVGAFQYWMADGGILEISGSGVLADFTEENPSPWKDDDKIKGVIIPDTISYIGDNAFSGCTNLKKIYYKGDQSSWQNDFEVSDTGNDEFRAVNDIYYNVKREDNILWAYSVDGRTKKLTISGSGNMADYTADSPAPWLTAYKDEITDIVVEDTITSIGDNAFSGCAKAENITISEGVTSIGESAFDGCSKAKSVTIPSTVTFINDYAFRKTGLEEVVLPSGAELGNGVFAECTSLASVILPDDLSTIGEETFKNCTELKDISISKNITKIYETAFEASGLECVYYFGSQSDWNKIDKGNYRPKKVYYDCKTEDDIIYIFDENTGIFEIVKGNEIKTYTDTVPSWSSDKMISAIIPGSITKIGANAFKDCTNIKNVYYDGSKANWQSLIITDTGNTVIKNASVYCDIHRIKDIIWSFDSDTGCLTIGGVGDIENYSGSQLPPWYDHKNRIKTVDIKSGVTNIGSYAFSDAPNLERAAIPNNIKGIGNFAFSGCSKLLEAAIPDGVTTIGNSAFNQCYALKSVSIPKTVVSIGDSAFNNCIALTEINIPQNVETIGNLAFDNCYKLEKLTVDKDNVNFVSENNVLFDSAKKKLIKYAGKNKAQVYEIPNSVETISSKAFASVPKLTTVIIPESVKTIEENALYKCISLSDLYYNGEKTAWDTMTISPTNSVIYDTNTTIHYAQAAPEASDEILSNPVNILGTFSDKYTNACVEYDGSRVTLVFEPIRKSISNSELSSLKMYIAHNNASGMPVDITCLNGKYDTDTNQVLFHSDLQTENCSVFLWNDEMQPVAEAYRR